MDPIYIFDNLISKDYDDIINNVYNDISNIIGNLEKRFDYSHKIIKGSITSLISFLRSSTLYDTVWLQITRELIIFLSREYSKFTVTIDDNINNIIQVDNDHKIKLMLLYMIFYHYDARSMKQKKLYTGVDFEFNERRIALCQVGFFPHRINKFIWVFDPNSLDSPKTLYLIKYLFTSEWVYKIVHGSDSLDIPYLFEELFMNNHTYIYSFITRAIDTRFLCEYYKNTVRNADKKCSIYDALLYFGTIDQQKYDELQHINKVISPIQDVIWNVYNMSSFNLKYAAYDTIYLRLFYFDILYAAKQNTPELYNSYQYIPLITRFIFLEKYNITELLTRIKSKVDPINNFIIKKEDVNLTLISIFNSVIKNMIIDTPSIGSLVINVNNLLEINYFKSSLTFLFKMIVYSILTNNFTIYKNKEEIYMEKLSLEDVFDTLKFIHLEKLRKLVKAFYITVEQRINDHLT